ncbi:M20/M25/M40 family metallo-hydrolase, partial [Paracoccus sp. SM22M-07]|uniref:M20/M25/M40 family metallo-hydrolase n=1 Tax=Paracoccus sp. SM22M-07 TaxID=1520813 RepID=UPI000AF89A6A
TISSGLCFFWGIPASSKWLKSHTSGRTTFQGADQQPGHSSDPSQGANAIYPAARLALLVDQVSESLRTEGPFDTDFAPPYSTMQVGVITGGAAVNIIPELARLLIETRTIPSEFPEAVMKRVLSALEDVAYLTPGVEANWRELARYPALAPSHDRSLAERLAKASGRQVVAAVSYGTEAGLFAEAGIPSVICGPGNIGRAHRANEYVLQKELNECRDVLMQIINERCA